MGQKVNPIGFRLGYTKEWLSSWYADIGSDQYAKWIKADHLVRSYFTKNYRASVSRIVIKRNSDKMVVELHAPKVALVIGKGGDGISKISSDLLKITGSKMDINVLEVKKPDSDAAVVAMNIVAQLEKRVSFKRAIKRAIASCVRNRVLGVKVICSGRLSGAEIARSEKYIEGRVPLHTLRADIDYHLSEALMPYGVIGVKVWIYKGDVNLSKVDN